MLSFKFGASLATQLVKNPPTMRETLVRLLSQEGPLEKGLATHSSIPGLPCGSAGKEYACSMLDLGSCLPLWARINMLDLSDLTQSASKFGKLSSGHRTGKGQFSFQSQRKAMPKNTQTTTQLHSSHTLVK